VIMIVMMMMMIMMMMIIMTKVMMMMVVAMMMTKGKIMIINAKVQCLPIDYSKVECHATIPEQNWISQNATNTEPWIPFIVVQTYRGDSFGC